MENTVTMYQVEPELSLRTAVSAAQSGQAALAQGQIDFDLAALTVVDSSAVAVLLEWQRAASAQGKSLRFHHIPASLESLISLYGVAELLTAPATGRH